MNYKVIIPLAAYMALPGCTADVVPKLDPKDVKLCVQPLSIVDSVRFGTQYQIMNGLKVCIKHDNSSVLVNEKDEILLEGQRAIFDFSNCFDTVLKGEVSKIESKAKTQNDAVGPLTQAFNGSIRQTCLAILKQKK